MGHGQQDLIREMFAVIDTRQFHRLHEFYTPDTVYERPGYPPIDGLAALEVFYRETRIVAAGKHELLHVVSDGDAMACWGHFVGSARDGRALEERFADAYELRDGRISRRITHFFRAAI